MARPSKKKKVVRTYGVVSYIDNQRRVHKVQATSYRDAKRLVARELRDRLEMYDTNLADITSSGLLTAHKLPSELL